METIEATYAELHRMLDEIEPLLLRFWDAKDAAFAAVEAEAARQADSFDMDQYDAVDLIAVASPGMKKLMERLGDLGLTD